MIEKKYKLKRTKVVATIGPGSLSKKKIRKMILAGLNVCKGNVTYKAVADAFGHKFISSKEAIT